MDDAPLMLSVSGLRGLVGRSLTPQVAAQLAAAFGQWLKERDAGERGPHVVLGRDSRPSGRTIELAVAAGLLSVGCRVTTLGIVTTPGVAIMIDRLGADGGMVVTASHNPVEWNGIKALRGDGIAPSKAQADEIIDRFKRDLVTYAAPDLLVDLRHDDTAADIHVQRVLRHIDVDAVRQRQLKVVLDSVRGAGGPVTAKLLEALGARVIHLNAEPTGLFPHAPEPTREHLEGLCRAVAKHGADAGFAQDPDADRLAVVDQTGRYIGEEYTLALAVQHVLRRDGTPSGGAVAANLSTSRMIDDVAEAHGARVIRTPVGEANVAEAMRAASAIFGGEGNGGVIWPVVGSVRDSLVGIALILESMAQQKQSLGELASRIPSYTIVKEKVEADPQLIAQLDPLMRRHFTDQRIDVQDGVRVDWPDRWVHVRPSNTEPIVRIIAEAADADAANDLVAEARRALGLTVEAMR